MYTFSVPVFLFTDVLLQLQAPVYALAEQASDIISDDWKQASSSNGPKSKNSGNVRPSALHIFQPTHSPLVFTIVLAVILSL